MIKKNYKLIILILLYLIIFYFLIFNNILKLMEIRENVEQKEIEIGKLKYEKNITFEALNTKRNDLEEIQKKIDEINQNDEKENFTNLGFLFSYLKEKINKHHINFISFARSQKDNENIKISMNLNGYEENIKNFLKEIEEDVYNINLSDSIFSIRADKNLVVLQVSLKTKIIEENDIILNDTTINNKNIFNLSDKTNSNIPLMRIGSKKFYRNKGKVLE